MNAPSGPDLGLHWLFNHSLQAGVLVLLVLLVQWVFRRQLTHRWRFALWWIVLARLLLPFSLESAVSLFNVLQSRVSLPGTSLTAPVASSVPMPDAASAQKQSVPDVSRPATATPVYPTQIQTTPAIVAPAHSTTLPPAWRWRDGLVPGLTGLWLAGVLVLTGVVAVQFLRFHRRLTATTPADESLRALLEDCRREFGTTRPIELLETDAVQSPALFGLFRLRLLLPRGLGGNFNRRELRYIFLHELAHVRRGDLWLNWLVTVLQILHWFNPLLWLGFARLRADRELACDELALLRAGDTAGTAYGETVVKLLERLSRPAAIPGLIGILEDKQQMRRRISMIANFRRPGRWSVLAVLLVAALALAALTDAQTSKPAEPAGAAIASATDTNDLARVDLTGPVTGPDGAPLPVPARVFIVSAVSKASYGNHSIYDDCDRHAQTDAQGNFNIEAVEPGLMFQILALAEGYRPHVYEYADPARGIPLKLQMQPLEAGETAAKGGLRGRVVNAQGRPIADAVVDLQGREPDGDPTVQQRAMVQETPAVTDGNGEFSLPMVMPADEWMDQLVARVTAQGYAGKTFKLSRTTPWELVMTEGASLHGRVLRAGRPLAGVTLRMSQLGGVYDGHYQVRTDARGNFKFAHLPPEADFQFSSPVETLTPFGAVPPRQLHTAKERAATDLGDLTAGPTHHLAGRVVLSDGQLLSSNTWLMAACDGVFLHKYTLDQMRITLGPDGAFDVPAFPVGTLSLYLSGIPYGYHWSGRNLSVDPVSRFQLNGRVEQDVTNLVFRLDPGELPLVNQEQQPDYPDLRNLPLRGVENTPDPAEQWFISGRVLDAVTRQPIPRFRVTAGRSERNFKQQAVWDRLSTVDGTNGVYHTYIRKHTGQPLLKVEAEGHLPACLTNLPARDVTNADFALQPGAGVAGRVIQPDGRPAAGATVLLLNDDYNQAQFYPPGILAFNNMSKSLVSDPAVEQTTDAAGRFTFKPLLGMKTVAAANTNGFALVSLATLGTNPIITLEPYGAITGTVTRAGRPATNEELNLRFDDSVTLARGLNCGLFAHTDAQGRYAFDHVPAGHLFLYGNVKTANGYGPNPATQNLELKPGQTLEVNLNPGNSRRAILRPDGSIGAEDVPPGR
jgi:beta-lactamase regulating signal transducer with metallopeptidase domain